MGYIDQNLMSGENVIHRTKIHWVIFLWPAIFLLIAMIGFASKSGTVGGIFIVLAILTGLRSVITYSTSEFGVTNKRILIKVGFIRRNSLEILLTKVEGIQVNQGILGRILDYGTIVVTGTGGSKQTFHKISTPLEFRKKSQEQIEKTSAS